MEQGIPTLLDAIEKATAASHASSTKNSTRMALAWLAFGIALLSSIVVERVVRAVSLLIARTIWGTSNILHGCRQEPMRTLLHELDLARQGNHTGPVEPPEDEILAYWFDLAAGRTTIYSSSPLQGYASVQLVGAWSTFLSTIATSASSMVVSALASLWSYVLWAAAITLIFTLLFIAQESYSEVFISAVDQWNSGYGPVMNKLFVIPLQVADVLFSAIIPLYNAVFWIIKLILNNVLLDSLILNTPNLRDFGLALGKLCRHVALEVPSYTKSLVVPCDYSREGDFCYDAGNSRVFDVITAMQHVRTMMSSVSRVLMGACLSASGPINIALFPFMDINFAKGLHNIINAAMYTVFQIPVVTIQRCRNHGPSGAVGRVTSPTASYGSPGSSLLLCMPDFNQPINMLVQGLRDMGIMADNWLDVSSIILQRSMGWMSAEEAEMLDCERSALATSPAFYSKALFDDGSNRHKIVVGLTDSTYAVTDGRHVQYFNHYDSVESVLAPSIWPFDIDTRYGVAAVAYGNQADDRDGMGNPTTTMMGCRCTDAGGFPPIKIECALALKQSIVAGAAASLGQDASPTNSSSAPSNANIVYAQQVFEVMFQQRSTANYMTCDMAQISVQSVRWPATRFTGSYKSTRFQMGALDRGMVDATVWVSPLCTSRAAKFPEVCTPMFKAAACYPYCMAARLRGHTGPAALVLYNSPDWNERVHLMQRDCIVDTPILSNPLEAVAMGTAQLMPRGTSSSTDPLPAAEATSRSNVMVGSSVQARSWNPKFNVCMQASTATSILRRDVHPAYNASAEGGATISAVQATVPRKRTFRSLLSSGQPFAYAGDVILTSVRNGQGQYFVEVDRLYGNEVNEYTMVPVRTRFPANPPADTIKKTEEIVEIVDRLPTPYTFSDMGGVQHPAVSTRSSVFFAVNPSLAMFRCLARGCSTEGYEWCTQLSALSSYAPIKIWRIDPFAYCPADSSGAGEVCGIGRVHHAEIPDAFTRIVPPGETGNAQAYNVFDIRKCEVPFSVAVVGMDYINEENIAITVLKASFYDYSPDTGLLRPDAKNASYQVYYLSTANMNLSSTPHDRDIMMAATSAAEGKLCPAMRRLPNVGSFLAEAYVAGIELVRKVLDIVLVLPAVSKMWEMQEACPIITHGHSLLQKCGSDLLSLDDFFDAINRANAHFWRSFSIIAERTRSLGGLANRVANIVDGVAYYGESTISPTTTYSSLIMATKIPVKETASQLMQAVMPVPGMSVPFPLFRRCMLVYIVLISICSGNKGYILASQCLTLYS